MDERTRPPLLARIDQVGKDTMNYATLPWAEISRRIQVVGYWPSSSVTEEKKAESLR